MLPTSTNNLPIFITNIGKVKLINKKEEYTMHILGNFRQYWPINVLVNGHIQTLFYVYIVKIENLSLAFYKGRSVRSPS